MDWVCSFAEWHYIHLQSIHRFRYTSGNSKNAQLPTINSCRIENSGFSVFATDKPELVWNIFSLKSAIETVYTLEATAEKLKMKLCKTCLVPFVAANPKAEFCSKKCGNVMHVRNFRR